MTTKEFKNVSSNELKNGQYVVLANTGDGCISIGINGKYGFDTLKEAVDIQFDHLNIDKDVKVSVFEVQKEIDADGSATINFVQAEAENLVIGENQRYLRNGSYAVCQSITRKNGIITKVLSTWKYKQEAIEDEYCYIDLGKKDTFVAQLFCYKNADSDTPLFKAYRLSEEELFITD